MELLLWWQATFSRWWAFFVTGYHGNRKNNWWRHCLLWIIETLTWGGAHLLVVRRTAKGQERQKKYGPEGRCEVRRFCIFAAMFLRACNKHDWCIVEIGTKWSQKPMMNHQCIRCYKASSKGLPLELIHMSSWWQLLSCYLAAWSMTKGPGSLWELCLGRCLLPSMSA